MGGLDLKGQIHRKGSKWEGKHDLVMGLMWPELHEGKDISTMSALKANKFQIPSGYAWNIC